MLFRDKKQTPPPAPAEPFSAASPSDARKSVVLSSANGDVQGSSSLLLNEEPAGLAVPFDEEPVIPSARQSSAIMLPAGPMESVGSEENDLGVLRLDEISEEPPLVDEGPTFSPKSERAASPVVPPSKASSSGEPSPPASTDEEELRVILLDEAADEPLPEAAAPTAAKKPAIPAPPPRSHEPLVDEEELRVVSLDELTTTESPTPAAPTAPSDVADYADVSALLLGGGASPLIELAQAAGIPSAPAETESLEAPADFIHGTSSLLMGTDHAAAPAVSEEPSVETPRRWKRSREKVRIVPPEPQAKVQWFSNADACALYCRKHHRPLLLYFTTGDVEQCRTYEEAIRRDEMRPFLCSYVCCLVNMAQVEGRKVAMRLGVPTDGPAMVVFSPSGREYARVLKPEADWRFLATMLFWGLR